MRRTNVLLALVTSVAVSVGACASNERPEVVPGSTIATSSTTDPSSTDTSQLDPTSTTDPDSSTASITTTSIPRLDPDDPDYPTQPPPLPRPTVSYPIVG